MSATTVSRVLSNSPIPTDATRKVVMEAARKLGYRPDPVLSAAFRRPRSSHAPVTRETRVIGYLATSNIHESQAHSDRYYSDTLMGFHSVLKANRYHMLWDICELGQTQIPDIVAEHRVDGLLMQTNVSPGLRQLLTQQLPVVFIDRAYADQPTDCVLMNFDRAAHDQLTMLWNLGHRRIACFTDSTDSYYNGAIRRAHRNFFMDRDLDVPCQDLNQPVDINPATDAQVMQDYFHRLLHSPSRPTAVLVMYGYALSLLELAEQQGVPIPQRLSVAGVNEMHQSQGTRLGLTTYSMPMGDIGAAAAELLLERIKFPGRPPKRILIEGQPLIRTSCGPTPSSDNTPPENAPPAFTLSPKETIT
ncbi:MAG: LacI family DNA-binding transcriptional regulator [Phycisphaeraceae bacterium]|nr:LacI family DNA-binding transcriptional regulator [Phycisphaeraceae bacterium]